MGGVGGVRVSGGTTVGVRVVDGEGSGRGMCGEDDDDLRDDLRGLPLERKIGVDVVLVTLGRGVVVSSSSTGVGRETGEVVVGKGTEAFKVVRIGTG